MQKCKNRKNRLQGVTFTWSWRNFGVKILYLGVLVFSDAIYEILEIIRFCTSDHLISLYGHIMLIG